MVAESALERMQAIVEDTLTLARWGRAVEPTGRASVSLVALAKECWATVDTADATLEVDGDLTMTADPGRFRHFVENLFRNAVEHVGPAVTVRGGGLPDGEGFFVEDDGPGIPEGERKRVLEAGHTTAENGTGFGLAIVKRVAEAHGWSLDFTEGSTGGARCEVRFGDVDG